MTNWIIPADRSRSVAGRLLGSAIRCCNAALLLPVPVITMGRLPLLAIVFTTALSPERFTASGTLNSTTKGREFSMAFPAMDSNRFANPKYKTLSATFSNPTSVPVEVRIAFHGFLADVINLTLPAQYTQTMTLPDDLLLSGNGKQMESAYVTSSDDIIVQATMEYRDTSQWSMASYTVLPRTALTADYIVATHCVDYLCLFIVTSVDDDNVVTVTLRLAAADGSGASYGAKAYGDGDVFKDRLNNGQSMLVTCSKCDLTGTWVSATKKVAVVSGGDFTLFSMTRPNRDAVLEQMMPMESLGRHYVVGSNYYELECILKVVPLRRGQSFQIMGQRHEATKDRQVFTFGPRKASDVVEIIADDQVLLVQIVASSWKHSHPDSSMLLPAPLSQWSTSYQLYSGVWDSVEKVFVSLIVPRGLAITTPGIQPVFTSKETSSSGYDKVNMRVHPHSLVTVQCQEQARCRPFSGFVVIDKNLRSSAFALREQVVAVENPELSTTASHDKTSDEVTFPVSVTTENYRTQSQTASQRAEVTPSKPVPTESFISAVVKQRPEMSTSNSLMPITTMIENNVDTTAENQQQNNLNTDSYIASPSKFNSPSDTTESKTFSQSNVTMHTKITSLDYATTKDQDITNDVVSTTQEVTVPNNGQEPSPTARSQTTAKELTSTIYDNTLNNLDISTYSDTHTPKTPIYIKIQKQQRCHCVKNITSSKKTQKWKQEIEAAQEKIRKSLLEDRKSFSSYTRSKMSSPNDKPASVAMGYTIGIAAIAVVFVFVAGYDIVRVVHFVKCRLRNTFCSQVAYSKD